MKGPRHHASKIALALMATLLLPACAARKPIPSDPPEVRTESMVRGKAGHAGAPKPAEQAPAPPAQSAALQGPVVETVLAEKKDPQNTNAQINTAVAKVDARMSEATADAQIAAKPNEAKKPEVKAPEKAEAQPDVKKAGEADASKPSDEKQAEKQPEPQAAADEGKKAETAQKTGTEPAKDAAQQTAAQAAPHAYLVQIASFSTEKNANAALTWLKDKGYSDARITRAEQAQTVYHRVQAGPFQDLAAARKALEELKADWPQAFIPAD